MAFDFSLPFFKSNALEHNNSDTLTECIEIMNSNTDLWENKIPVAVFEINVGDEKYYIQQSNNVISLIEYEVPTRRIWTNEDTLDDVHKILIDVDGTGKISFYQTLQLLKIYKITPMQTDGEMNIAGQVIWKL